MSISKNIILLILFSAFAFGGCIKEDNSDCHNELLIRFVPQNPKHILPEIVLTADLYLFEMDGMLISRYHYKAAELRTEDRTAVIKHLPAGNYRLLALINDGDRYRTAGTDFFPEIRTYLDEEEVINRPVDFFSGVREVTIENTVRKQEEDVTVFKHTNDIRVIIRSDGYLIRDDRSLECRISGNNGMFHYSTHSCSEPAFRVYHPYYFGTAVDNSPLIFEFSILRLWTTSDMTLILEEKNTIGNTLRSTSLNIAEELAKVRNDYGEYLYDTDWKLEYNDDYEIAVTLGVDFTIIELSINDWAVIGDEVTI